MAAVRPLRPDDPERLGPYRLTGRLGEGGQGVVYLGERERGGGQVAVKLLHGGLGGEPEGRARFQRELETAKRVAAFCTAAVLDADTVGDRPYIVSEFVDGPSLRHVVAREGPRVGGALQRLAVGTATALVAIHQAGVVHRDFKPHNVLLGPDGPRVIDFGIARALDGATITSGGAIGTPAYMAPEQLRGERAGPAADVFAWAATMVFASSGRLAFAADSVPAMAVRIMQDAPDLGGLTGPLRELAARCLAKDPERRPGSSEVLRELLGDTPPHGARPEGAPPDTVVLRTGPTASDDRHRPAASGDRQAASDGRPQAGDAPHRRAATVAVAAAVVAAVAAIVVSVVALSGRDGNGGARAANNSPPSVTVSSPRPSTATKTRVPNDLPARYTGTWSGRLTQNDGKVFPVKLVLDGGRAAGKVSYPQQRCAGTETYVGRTGGTVTFHEKITAGAGRCVNTGTVTLTPSTGGRLMFSYSGDSPSHPWAVGPLARS